MSSETRKLAVIMFTDMVGYSRKFSENEEQAPHLNGFVQGRHLEDARLGRTPADHRLSKTPACNPLSLDYLAKKRST